MIFSTIRENFNTNCVVYWGLTRFVIVFQGDMVCRFVHLPNDTSRLKFGGHKPYNRIHATRIGFAAESAPVHNNEGGMRDRVSKHSSMSSSFTKPSQGKGLKEPKQRGECI